VSLLCLLSTEAQVRAAMAPPQGWLTPTERARLDSLGSAARRDSFLAGRWLARDALRQWRHAAALPVLAVDDSGACRVADGGAGFVSISHGAGRVACAVADVPVGVDLESLARPRDAVALAEVVHGPAQREQLAQRPPSERAELFLRLWTLKEAWLKARGQGLDLGLMRRLSFEDAPRGDVAVTVVGDLVLAVAADPVLPARLDTPQNAAWRPYRTRITAS
jgi:4'-phosphopantetheinyl transferase